LQKQIARCHTARAASCRFRQSALKPIGAPPRTHTHPHTHTQPAAVLRRRQAAGRGHHRTDRRIPF
jgi:hypothetical protein